MNIIQGVITHVQTHQNLSLVTVNIQDVTLSAVVIDTPETSPYLQLDQAIRVLFKETEVILGQNVQGHVSLRNQLPGEILKIQRGVILSKVTLQTSVGEIISIITTNAVKALNLEEGNRVTAMIKTNEVMLSM